MNKHDLFLSYNVQSDKGAYGTIPLVIDVLGLILQDEAHGVEGL